MDNKSKINVKFILWFVLFMFLAGTTSNCAHLAALYRMSLTGGELSLGGEFLIALGALVFGACLATIISDKVANILFYEAEKQKESKKDEE